MILLLGDLSWIEVYVSSSMSVWCQVNNSSCVLQENSRLEEEVSVLKEKLSEAQSTISKLQKDLDHLLQDKVRHIISFDVYSLRTIILIDLCLFVLLNSMVALIQMAQDC